MSDIVSSRTGARTYPLPKSVVEEAVQGLRWQQAYGTPVRDSISWMGALLSSGGSVTAEMVAILAHVGGTVDTVNWGSPTDEDWPNVDRVEGALSGGRQFRKWTDRIMSGIQRDQEAAIVASLVALEYDDSFTYLGITDAQDDCLVRNLVRVGENSLDWQRWSGETWDSIPADQIQRYSAVELDMELVGVTASALAESDGLMLMFAEPVAWLPWEPMVAAAPEDVESGAHYYAVVDSTDNTAVMDLITISPGPVVKVRQAGAWADAPQTLELLRGINPPSLVELSDEQLEMVRAQIDGDAITDESHVESLGHEDEIVEKREEQEADKAAEFARTRAQSAPLAASLASAFKTLDIGDVVSHGSVAQSALKASAELQLRAVALETLTSAPLVAAGENRGSAESLKRYWLYGKGAVKIKWGTAGDWTRCYRQLSKYLGTRAKGYCNLRHKEATGMYAGDRRNV